ncbi:MAG: hypothetical protein U9Q77_01940 [Candidatus Marinimicrobia bacterium]|nr:hypothetical protein [Candidatus Neomarinimicrobiota bacterium]
MDQIIIFIKTQLKRDRTIPLIGAGIILMVIAFFMGISDNIPGIVVAFAGMTLIVFAFLHHWREARLFGTLFAVSVISFPVLVLLHNIFDGINQNIGTIPILNQLLSGLAVMSFLGAIFLAPAGILIGLIAGLFYLVKSKS